MACNIVVLKHALLCAPCRGVVPQELLASQGEGVMASPLRLLIVQHSLQSLLVQDDLPWADVSTCAAIPAPLSVVCYFILWQ